MGERQWACHGIIGLALSFTAIAVRHHHPPTLRSSTMHGAADIIAASRDHLEGGGRCAVVFWVAGRDGRDSGCAVPLLGRQQLYRGMRALVDVGRQAAVPCREVC